VNRQFEGNFLIVATAIWRIEAGNAGGDFDAYIADMGNPLHYSYLSNTANQTVLVHQGKPVGAQMQVVLDAGGFQFIHNVLLRAADGSTLMRINLGSLQFGMERPKSGADVAFDSVMDAIQSPAVGNMTFGFAFSGNRGADKFTGNLGDDVITGAAGRDTLAGAGGNDTLIGGSGDDVIAGGAGIDLLTGGLGADQFVFSGAAVLASGDKMTDFSQAEGDRVDLRGVDAKVSHLGLDHFTLIATDFTGEKGELRISLTAKGAWVLGDTDGNGAADFQIALLGVTSLDAMALLLV
jgi:Ca2+-binding RTX toxin-like protein